MTLIIAELGINHNGSLDTAKRMIDAAILAGADAVKFQKRTPELCTPDSQRSVMRETPWGYIPYLEYRKRMEFGHKEYRAIAEYCKYRIGWFVSVWDDPSVDFMEDFTPPYYKIPSACLTDHRLLRRVRQTKTQVILSTGMSTMNQIRAAVREIGTDNLTLMHCTSSYPCKHEELNLRMIPALIKEFRCPVGYSGHEIGLAPSVVAVALGACMIERHFTLDRTMWGTDQSASVEPQGFARLVRDIRVCEVAMGDGVKRVYNSEKPSMDKLRMV